ncbi:GspE/PulE family protein [Chloroflexota bacterium]
MKEHESAGIAHKIKRKSLGEILVEQNIITSKQLNDVLNKQRVHGGKLGEILISKGLVKAEELASILSIQLNIPLVDLKRQAIQPEALQLIPEDMARNHTLIPLAIIGDSLSVIMADPDDIRTIKDLEAQSRMRVEVALGIPSDIERAIDLNYRPSYEIEKKVGRFTPYVLLEQILEDTRLSSEFVAKTPVAESLDLIIQQAVRDRASDIHIEPRENWLRIRYRIDGILHDMYSLPLSTHAELVSRIKILAEMDIAQQKRPQDGQFPIVIGDRNVDIRTATTDTAFGERVTLRILDKSLSIFTLPQLGFQPDALEKHQAMLNSPYGIILVGGPTGSGKTTTLYTSINQLDRNERNIMTVEDPIEYRFENISQSQVNAMAGITFASGLRAILRQDPDIILVGEIRDKDTATTAVQAAITGHLVLSSIHANDAVGVLLRLIDLGVEPSLIAATLVGTVAQRMVRRICTDCRASYQPSATELAAYSEEIKEKTAIFYQGTGCNLCAGTGYRGRIALFELLVMSEEIRKMVLNNASASDIKAQALREQMVTMKHDGMMKVKEGITSVSEVLRSVFSVS